MKKCPPTLIGAASVVQAPCPSERSTGVRGGPPRHPVARLRSFVWGEEGGISIFVLILFILLLVVGGLAVDYQRYESARADLQDALDRGTLAATNKEQDYKLLPTLSVKEQAAAVVKQYMASRNHKGGHAISLDVDVLPIPGGRQVAATATLPLDTVFLSLIGTKTLDVKVESTAVQAISNIEITLILDITGSMTWTSQSGLKKINDLKIAAKQFLDTVLADPQTRTLISIVPFSQNVNLPRGIADLYNINRHHDYASCIDYNEFDFTTTALPLNRGTPYLQAQHFRENVGTGNYGCPKNNNAATLYSNDLAQLKAAIDALTPETWTAMYMGMKWGAALLDPSSRPIVDAKIANGTLSDTFAGWPHSYNDPSARKIFVLMSDGQNTRLNEIYDDLYILRSVLWWHTNNPGSAKFSLINNDVDGVGDLRLRQICDTVKAAATNEVIYTIGFEVSGIPSAQAALSNCASSPSTYYLVEGVQISTAFQSIAQEITNLKLIN